MLLSRNLGWAHPTLIGILFDRTDLVSVITSAIALSVSPISKITAVI